VEQQLKESVHVFGKEKEKNHSFDSHTSKKWEEKHADMSMEAFT